MSKPKNMTPEQYEKWREQRRENHRKWVDANPEKVKKSRKKWVMSNPDKLRLKARKAYYANPEKARQRSRIWAKNNREKVCEYNKKWYVANKERIKEYSRKYRVENEQDIKNRKYNEAANLSPLYIAGLLNIPTAILKSHPNLIEAKREQIKILRELKPQNRKNKHNAQESKQPATSPR